MSLISTNYRNTVDIECFVKKPNSLSTPVQNSLPKEAVINRPFCWDKFFPEKR